MRNEKLLKILLSPHVSEKTTSSAGQYVFEVHASADKSLVKKAVEQLFGVKVKAVNIVNVKGASALKFGRAKGKYASWKKAYVVLHEGQQINFA